VCKKKKKEGRVRVREGERKGEGGEEISANR
jgi:hypothetical protein